MFDLRQTARFAGMSYEGLRKLVQRGFVDSTENLGDGRGNGHRFSLKDVDTIRVFAALRGEGWSCADAATAARCFRSMNNDPEALRIIVYPNGSHKAIAVGIAQPLPAEVLIESTVLIANLRAVANSSSSTVERKVAC